LLSWKSYVLHKWQHCGLQLQKFNSPSSDRFGP
jgi:hypothetical protein